MIYVNFFNSNIQKIPKLEVAMTQKPKNPITYFLFFFRPAVLHDHAASRQVKMYTIHKNCFEKEVGF